MGQKRGCAGNLGLAVENNLGGGSQVDNEAWAGIQDVLPGLSLVCQGQSRYVERLDVARKGTVAWELGRASPGGA